MSGGKKVDFDIVKFIKSESNDSIEDNLLDKMKNDYYCDQVLGKGFAGVVKIQKVGKTVKISVGNQKIKIPIVVKTANEEGKFEIKEIKGKLYIWGHGGLTLEAIILTFVNKVAKITNSPHLPFMIGYSSCVTDSTHISRIITVRHGLKSNVKMNVVGFDESPIWHPQNPDNHIFDKNMAILSDLLDYITIKRKDEEIILPNGVTCNVIKLLDYLTISYLHTHHLLFNNGIICSDMHSHNIFIHWLNPSSFMGDQLIENVKYIYYNINGLIFKIETFGLLLKIGDVGTFIIDLKDKMILGQANELELNIGLVDEMVKEKFGAQSFMSAFRQLPISIYEKTIAHKISYSYPYNEITGHLPINQKLLDDFKTPFELLKYFDKYQVKIIEDKSESLVVG